MGIIKNVVAITIGIILAVVILTGTCIYLLTEPEESNSIKTQTIVKPEAMSVNSFYCTDVFEEHLLGASRCNPFISKEFFILGLLKNPNDVPVYSVRISYTLYDKDNMVIGSGERYPHMSSIPPKESVPFIIAHSDTANITSYKLNIHYDKSGYSAPYRHFEQYNMNMKKIEEESMFGNNCKIIIGGEVKNTGDSLSGDTEVIAVLYDKDGKIVDILHSYTNPSDTPPNETASFVIEQSYSKNGLAKIDIYKLWIQGEG